MSRTNNNMEESIQLEPSQQAQSIDQLIINLDKTNKDIDRLFAKEAESRLDAYKRGELKSISLTEVLSKYQ